MQKLYIIECQKIYKIGVTHDIKARLAQLSTGNPFQLKVELYYEFENAEVVEKALHQKYAKFRKRGEWFEFDDYNILRDIHKICLMLGGHAYEYIEEVTDESIKEAEKEIEESEWLELVKVKKWYYVRIMRWNSTDGKKEYVRHIGTLEECKNNELYSAEAYRLEKQLAESE